MGLYVHRKITATLLSLMMVLTVFPAVAFAEDPTTDELTPDPAPAVESEQEEQKPLREEKAAAAVAEETKTEAEREQPSGETDTESTDDREEITVSFSLEGEKNQIWLEQQELRLPPESTVMQLIETVLNDNQYDYSVSDKGEIIRISRPQTGDNPAEQLINGMKGPDSCWTFDLNGSHDAELNTEYSLSDGETVTVYFVDDIAKLNGATAGEGSDTNEESTTNEESAAGEEGIKTGNLLLPALGASAEKTADAYGNTSKVVSGMAETENWEYGAEWVVIGQARAGAITDSQINRYISNVEATVRSNGSAFMDKRQSSDNSKLILALTAIGKNPEDIAGYNLLEPLANLNYVRAQGVNGPIWALIAFDSKGYEIPVLQGKGTQTSRQNLLSLVLGNQNSDGGWTFSGSKSDIDMTAMAIQSLAPYYKDSSKVDESTYKRVQAAVDKALSWISKQQKKDGTFAIGGSDPNSNQATSESSSQVLTALTSLNIDPEKDSRFIKNGCTVVDGLLHFYTKGGGFKHIDANSRYNELASMQGNYALVSYYRFRDGKNSLYDMSDNGEKYVINPKYHDEKPDKPSGDEDKPSGDKGKASGTKVNPAAKKQNNTAGGKTATLSGKTATKSVKLKAGGKMSAKAGGVSGEIKKAISGNLPSKAENYDKDQIRKIQDIYRNYIKLSPAEKLAVEKDKSWKTFNKICSSLGKYWHYDQLTGVDLMHNKESVLPWYVKMTVKEAEADKERDSKIRTILGEGSEIFSMYEISFINTLTGKEWKPEKIVTVRIPAGDSVKAANRIIVHLTDKGEIELIDGEMKECRTADGEKISVMQFSAADFSLYGIAGMEESVDNLMGKQKAEILPWIIAVAVAMLLVLILAFARRRLSRSGE